MTGGTDAVEDLVRTHHRRLVRAVALSCGSVAAAEDAVQDALAHALREPEGVRE